MRPGSRHCLLALLAALVAGLLLAGCGGAALRGTQPPAFRARSATPTPPLLTTPTARPAAAGTVIAISPRSVVRTYADAQQRTVTLYHGRAVGRRGDWGWAHIIGKHLKGEWRDGGPVTTFDVIGVTTPEAVQEIIGRALREDAEPDPAAQGRRLYRLPVATTGFEVLAVVGADGAIITAYPDPIRRPVR